MKKIQIFGSGCAKCKKLAEAAEQAAKELGIPCEFEKVTDFQKIAGFGVMTTPALVVDGKVMAAGKVLSLGEIKKMLQ
jgi:small redox-active disulfide protein 2